MSAASLRIEATRGDLVESVHPVEVAVVDGSGRLVASSGDPDRVCWWRSAAKPFQTLPLLEDGAAERFALSDEELALIAASHSSEPRHLELVTRLMEKVGVTDDDLSCGPHPPLSAEVARAVAGGRITLTARWSNCSGKHTGMLALARHHGWPLAGYHAAGHPVQERILEEVSRWTGVGARSIQLASDGCTAVCFGLPLRSMALAYARLGASDESSAERVRRAMMGHPFLVAGTGRLCTDLMSAWPGRVLAKVGAEGIYSALLVGEGLGVALKVSDGDNRSAALALMEVLRQVLQRFAPTEAPVLETGSLREHSSQTIRNTRGAPTGEFRPAGTLRFSAH